MGGNLDFSFQQQGINNPFVAPKRTLQAAEVSSSGVSENYNPLSAYGQNALLPNAYTTSGDEFSSNSNTLLALLNQANPGQQQYAAYPGSYPTGSSPTASYPSTSPTEVPVMEDYPLTTTPGAPNNGTPPTATPVGESGLMFDGTNYSVDGIPISSSVAQTILSNQSQMSTVSQIYEEGLAVAQNAPQVNNNSETTQATDSEVITTTQQAQSDAIDIILSKNDNPGEISGDDYDEAMRDSKALENPEVIAAIQALKDRAEDLSNLDGDDASSVNAGELRQIQGLIKDHRYSIFELSEIGASKHAAIDDALGTDIRPILAKLRGKTQAEDDQHKADTQEIRNHEINALNLLEQHGGNIDEALADSGTTGGILDALNMIKEHQDSLSNLDGEGGSLNETERGNLLELVSTGYTLGELVDIGKGHVNPEGDAADITQDLLRAKQ